MNMKNEIFTERASTSNKKGIYFNRNSLENSALLPEKQITLSKTARIYSTTPNNRIKADRMFRIIDSKTKITVNINVPEEKCSDLTVDWLFDSYLKSQLGDSNFDMGSVGCLRTVSREINYDYALTIPSMALEVFPSFLELEPYYSECCQAINYHSFHVLRLAGMGGFAKVAIVRKRDTGQIFAMKIIDKQHMQFKEREEYIFEEKKILTQLAHPSLVSLF